MYYGGKRWMWHIASAANTRTESAAERISERVVLAHDDHIVEGHGEAPGVELLFAQAAGERDGDVELQVVEEVGGHKGHSQPHKPGELVHIEVHSDRRIVARVHVSVSQVVMHEFGAKTHYMYMKSKNQNILLR